MPPTAYEIKARLDKAVDQEGNVLNLEIVLELVSTLEKLSMTTEALEATRIGRIINIMRKKTANDELSKRLKKLLKKWQTLVNNHILIKKSLKSDSPVEFSQSPSAVVNGTNKRNEVTERPKGTKNQVTERPKSRNGGPTSGERPPSAPSDLKSQNKVSLKRKRSSAENSPLTLRPTSSPKLHISSPRNVHSPKLLNNSPRNVQSPKRHLSSPRNVHSPKSSSIKVKYSPKHIKSVENHEINLESKELILDGNIRSVSVKEQVSPDSSSTNIEINKNIEIENTDIDIENTSDENTNIINNKQIENTNIEIDNTNIEIDNENINIKIENTNIENSTFEHDQDDQATCTDIVNTDKACDTRIQEDRYVDDNVTTTTTSPHAALQTNQQFIHEQNGTLKEEPAVVTENIYLNNIVQTLSPSNDENASTTNHLQSNETLIENNENSTFDIIESEELSVYRQQLPEEYVAVDIEADGVNGLFSNVSNTSADEERWYDWTETIPKRDNELLLLPYVILD